MEFYHIKSNDMKFSKSIYQYIPTLASVLYIVLFVYAASSKLFDFDNFRIQLGQSPILTAYADWVSWGIPILELAIAVLFLVPKYMVLAFYASFLLMLMFTSYIILILNFSDFIPCSCGGVLDKLSWTDHIIFNIVFIAIAVIGLKFSNNPEYAKFERL
jgi:uncharacterized membrane protein YphA (DoxX/SURF4 family)